MGDFSTRPNIELNMYLSSVAISGTSSRITYTLQLNETAEQPSFSGFLADNSWSASFSWDGGSFNAGSGNYTFDFRPTGNQNITLATGTFDVPQYADGNGRTVTTSSSSTSVVLGSASSGTQITPSFIAPPAPSWSTGTTLTAATRGTAYSRTVTASPVTSYSLVSQSGGTGTYSVSSGGVITGTPTATGTANVTVRAANYSSTTDRTFSFTVNPALPVFSDGSVSSSARVGIAYSDGVSASETSSYSVVAAPNNLPPGLSLNTSNGAITGTPTTPGTYSFKIRATNVTGSTDTATLTITVISAARVWNGTAFVSGLANVWNGSAFVTGTIRVWDGSTWRNTN
jgi:hypothetical protein